MQSYLAGTLILSNPELIGDDAPRAKDWWPDSAKRYEVLKRLPTSELKVRAEQVVAELRAWQTSVLANDNARAYAAMLEQTVWQKRNGDLATTDDEKRLAYVRCVHMAEDALQRFTAMGPGDSYWDTYIETWGKMRDAVTGGAGSIFEWLTGIPPWALWVGGAVVVGGVGYSVWKIAALTAPTIASTVVRRYLP